MSNIQHSMNSRLGALAIVLLAWALIYLPSLGSIAIKGEEGRRILPAIRMLETGNFIVPQVGSNPYYRKPPLVNWLVAASFKISGVRNEWTARLPSALAVLAVAIAFVTVARASLGPRGSTLACKRLAAASSSCALCRTGHHADRIVRVSDEDLHKY